MEKEIVMTLDQAGYWFDKAEATPDVFGRPKIAPQGQDGTAHLSYYDRERSLSFIWDGHYDQHVTVSQGGYGEPAKWTFDYLEIYNAARDHVLGLTSARQVQARPVMNAGQEFWAACAHFKDTCDFWITMMEEETDERPEGSA